MFVELHVLQNFAPSCLNRDDTNTPKDCLFGGHRRARISSQCAKRAARRYFSEANLLPPERLAERSKRLIGAVADIVVTTLPTTSKEDAVAAVKKALSSVKLTTDAKKPDETQYLLFLGQAEIAGLAAVVANNLASLTPKAVTESGTASSKKMTKAQEKSLAAKEVSADVTKAVKAVFNGGKAADVALFGRMLADQADLNVDAACQVAHALSTNRIEMEMDFYTAVDDLKDRAEEEDAGAGMLGTSEFNSACLYRYSNIHVGQLVKNLGNDTDLARATIAAYLTAAVKAVPTGKQNSTAAQNPPSMVFAVVRKAGLWSLANAFVKPVVADRKGDLIENSVTALDKHWGELAQAYGTEGEIIAAAAFALGDLKLANLQPYRVPGFDALLATVAAALAKETA